VANEYETRRNRVKADTAQRHQKDVKDGFRDPKNRRSANVMGAIISGFDPMIENDAMEQYGSTVRSRDASARGAVGIEGNQGSQSGPASRRNYGPTAIGKRMAKALRDRLQ